jgi:hypothetical protein
MTEKEVFMTDPAYVLILAALLIGMCYAGTKL